MYRYAGEQLFQQANANYNTSVFGSIVYNVRAYGAKGDGQTDDAASVQKVVNIVRLSGGTIYFPPGVYNIGATIDVDLSNHSELTDGKGLNIEGDNENSTVIVNKTASSYVFNIHADSAGGNSSFALFHMQNLTISGNPNAPLTNHGIHLSSIIWTTIKSIYFRGLSTATLMDDVVTCSFSECQWNGNANGLVANNQTNISTPNAIDFNSCVFYGNSVSAAYFEGGCNINFYGGTIETNGHNVSVTFRWGVRFNNSGHYGSAACNFYGVFFEGNSGIADVWITTKDYPCTYNFFGCTFNRFAPPLDNQNNIYLETGTFLGPSGPVSKLLVVGCGFRDIGNTPSASTKYIRTVSGGSLIMFEQYGNYFQSQVELSDTASNRTYASARIINLSSTPALQRGFNIDSIAKNGTGDYTINFSFPSVIAQKIYSFSMDIFGLTKISAETLTSVRMQTTNAAGVATDPGALMMICLE